MGQIQANFGVLRREYPTFNIPDPDTLQNLDVVHAHYEQYVKQFMLITILDNYKFYLIIMWASLELICTKLLGLDITGYTENQIDLMNKYERLLNELGEKSYGGIGANWPVEARIIMLALFNVVVFLIIKVIISYLPEGVGNMVKGLVRNFMKGNKENRQNSNAPALSGTNDGPTDNEIPNPPERGGGLGGLGGLLGGGSGGFNIGSIISNLGGLFGGGNNNANNNNNNSNESNNRRRGTNRRPEYDE